MGDSAASRLSPTEPIGFCNGRILPLPAPEKSAHPSPPELHFDELQTVAIAAARPIIASSVTRRLFLRVLMNSCKG
jgi:hypothetical protein